MHTPYEQAPRVSIPLSLWQDIVNACTTGAGYSNSARSILVNTLCAISGKEALQMWQHEDTDGSIATNIAEHLDNSRNAHGEMFTFDLQQMLWELRRFAITEAHSQGLQVADLLTETLEAATNKP